VRAVRLILMLLVVCAGAPMAAAQGQISETRVPRTTAPPLPPSPGTFLGGVPTGTASAEPFTLTIVDAIRRALDHNLGVLTAEQGVGRASGARWRALSDMLPNVAGRIAETRQTINLQAYGFTTFGSAFGNIPPIVGPFTVFDARVSISQALLDVGAMKSASSESYNLDAARGTYHRARNFVVHVAGNLYIQALAALARAEAARTQQETAQTLYRQAIDLKQGGLIAGIEVLRAEVELNTQTQRTTAATNDLDKAKLQVARAIGLPLGQPFTLDPNIPELPDPDITLEQAVDSAYRSRPDYQAALDRVKAAAAARDAVHGDRLPSVRVNADYGNIGLSASDAHTTYSIGGVVSVPVFQGGRVQGRLLEAEADLRDRQSEAEDLKASIYYEVRTAFLDLQATTEQLQVAGRARDLAAQQLTQARDRFAAGVASNIEVVQAQEAVALASEQYITARYGYGLAKGALVLGTGATDTALRQILGGAR